MHTECLNIFDSDHLNYAADLIADGEIVGSYLNGGFVFFGDVDQEEAAKKVFKIKKRPYEKTLGLCCDPLNLHEHVDLTASVFDFYSIQTIQQLYREIHALGLILPASASGTPSYLIQDGTILIVWTEYPPHYPVRQLIKKLREKGKRALLGASANISGEPTYITLEQMIDIFWGKVPLILNGPNNLPMYRKKSTTIVDFTTKPPCLIREGSVPEKEIREHLVRLGLGELFVGQDVIRL